MFFHDKAMRVLLPNSTKTSGLQRLRKLCMTMASNTQHSQFTKPMPACFLNDCCTRGSSRARSDPGSSQILRNISTFHPVFSQEWSRVLMVTHRLLKCTEMKTFYTDNKVIEIIETPEVTSTSAPVSVLRWEHTSKNHVRQWVSCGSYMVSCPRTSRSFFKKRF